VSATRSPASRALLADLDGTLTDNYEGISRSIVHALALLGIERAIAHYRTRYAETGWRENVVYAGIADVLAQLAVDGTTLVLCTSKPQPYAERIVAHFGLAPHFAAVHGADLGSALDDKATLVARLLAHEGLAANVCTMIGDREHDVRAAHANGVRAVGVLWGYGSREELALAGADALAATPAELPDVLASLVY
jgi:phosphoglycolate phosphatase